LFSYISRDILVRHIEAAKTSAEEIGLVKAKERRTDNHYRWFIRHHVFGETFEEITDEMSVEDVGNIRAQINQLYDLETIREL
jgi:hypothetical protein